MLHTIDFSRVEAALATRPAGSTSPWFSPVSRSAGSSIAGAPAASARPRRAAASAAGGVTRVIFPLVTLLLADRRHGALPPLLGRRSSSPSPLPTAVALALIRMVVYALRRVFPRAPGSRRPSARSRSPSGACVVLYFVGCCPRSPIDARRSCVIPIGKSAVSVLTIGKAILVVVLTLARHAVDLGLHRERADARRATRHAACARCWPRPSARCCSSSRVLIALPPIGFDLTLLSVFGGALGVGIGLGLQKLASNYIAGFTILLDRSIRLGDMVTVDDRYRRSDQGHRALRRRAQPRRRRGDRAQRDAGHDDGAQPLVLVARGPRRRARSRSATTSDVEHALELMVEAARARAARADATPNPPAAFLARFADSGIDLELGVWIADPENGQGNLRSAINRAIWKAFHAQRHQHSVSAARDPRAAACAESPAARRADARWPAVTACGGPQSRDSPACR